MATAAALSLRRMGRALHRPRLRPRGRWPAGCGLAAVAALHLRVCGTRMAGALEGVMACGIGGLGPLPRLLAHLLVAALGLPMRYLLMRACGCPALRGMRALACACAGISGTLRPVVAGPAGSL